MAELGIHDPAALVDDNCRVLDAVDASSRHKPAVGVFHSLSATVTMMHQLQAPTFGALVLFDAPTYPPGADLDDMETVCQRLSSRPAAVSGTSNHPRISSPRSRRCRDAR